MTNLIDKTFKSLVVLFLGLITAALYDPNLALGGLVLAILFWFTVGILKKKNLWTNRLKWLLLFALILHLCIVILIQYAHFQPFSGGSGGYNNIHLIATDLSENFRQGELSFEGVSFYEDLKYPYRFYPVIIGAVYSVTAPAMIIGQLFGVWLSVLTILFLYLLVRQITNSDNWAFVIGLIASFYPSHLFYSGLLLKDSLVTTLIFAGLFLMVRLMKKFSLRDFLIFYIVLATLFNFRFYAAYALSFAFVISLIFWSNLELKKRIPAVFIVIFLIGILPQLIWGHGFFGIELFKDSFTTENIAFYQEKAYTSPYADPLDDPEVEYPLAQGGNRGYTSTWQRESYNPKEHPVKFSLNFGESFLYVLLGPFPWQLNISRHYLALIETLPWYLLMTFIIAGIIRTKKEGWPLIVFALIVFMVLALFINNYGVVTRIRIPAFLALLSLIPFAFKKI